MHPSTADRGDSSPGKKGESAAAPAHGQSGGSGSKSESSSSRKKDVAARATGEDDDTDTEIHGESSSIMKNNNSSSSLSSDSSSAFKEADGGADVADSVRSRDSSVFSKTNGRHGRRRSSSRTRNNKKRDIKKERRIPKKNTSGRRGQSQSRSSSGSDDGIRKRRRSMSDRRSSSSSRSSDSDRDSSSSDSRRRSSSNERSSSHERSSSNEEGRPLREGLTEGMHGEEGHRKKHSRVNRKRSAAAATAVTEVTQARGSSPALAAAGTDVPVRGRVKIEQTEATASCKTVAAHGGTLEQSRSPKSHAVSSSSSSKRGRRNTDSSSSDTSSSHRSNSSHRSSMSHSRRNHSTGRQSGDESLYASKTSPAFAKKEEEENSSSSSSSDDEAFGPLPVQAVKRKRGLHAGKQLTASKKAAALAQQQRLEELYLQNVPSSERYYKSFMHRDEVSHVVVSPLRGFIITGSVDGHVKFWIRTAGDIEFVKHFRAHIDVEGGLEFWCTDTCKRLTRETDPRLSFSLKSDTDFYELAKNKTHAIALAVSPDGQLLAVLGDDAHIRLFRTATGKLAKVYMDTVEMHQTAQHDPRQVVLHADALDFEFRVAAEKELNKSRSKNWQTICFDESSSFLIYPSLLGIKVVSVRTNKLCRIVGRPEHSLRFLAVALYQAQMQRNKPFFFAEAKKERDDKSNRLDAVVVASAFKKNRVYFFTPEAPADAVVDVRDIFNEKPSKEEQEALAPAAAAASTLSPSTRLGKTATIFTTAGDIFLRLFPQECPKTVENFCTHARNGYYDRCIFHRVIKGFMIQTGDPNGDGTGGESIWGGDFEDEFHRALKHDRPFTVSMANAGPNTNGSQFFITTVPCSWLDNKHTVFGRVVQGMDVVTKIECVSTKACQTAHMHE